jgi:hypothetical protein
VKEARFEIKTLQDKASTLDHSKLPSTTSKIKAGGVLGSDDPKNARVIRFYEDVTNLLVMGVKIQHGRYFDFEECTLTCVYTHVDSNAQSDHKDGKSEHLILKV